MSRVRVQESKSGPYVTSGKDAWQRAQVLQRFYDLNAVSIGGIGEHFQIVKFRFGYDPTLVDETPVPPILYDIPTNLESIPNVFYEGTFDPARDIAYGNGRLLFRCLMPKNAVIEPHQYSITGLYDQNDNLVVVSLDLPDWITPEDNINTHLFINFPFHLPETD